MERKCIDCGKVLRGRTDKKYCNDMCRNAYHNKNNRESEGFIRNVNNILKRNRRILMTLCELQNGSIRSEELNRSGFDFRYFTFMRTAKSGRTYFFCYEYGYSKLNENNILLCSTKNSN